MALFEVFTGASEALSLASELAKMLDEARAAGKNDQAIGELIQRLHAAAR